MTRHCLKDKHCDHKVDKVFNKSLKYRGNFRFFLFFCVSSFACATWMERFVMDSKGRSWRSAAAGWRCPSRMPGANYGNRWSLAIDSWQAPIQTLTGCDPSRSSSLRPDTLNSTLGIPVVVYLDWGPALVSLFLLWLWLGELRTSGFVISGDPRCCRPHMIQDAGKFRVNPKFPSWWLWISHDPRCQRHPMMSRHLIDIAILRQSLFIEMGL